jgi:DNA polymerase-3 subunit beta
MQALKINTNLLRAANVVASTEGMRYYLNGVSIEATRERVFYAATDGHRLVAFHHAAEWDDDTKEEERSLSIIIPKSSIEQIKINRREENGVLRSSDGRMWAIKKGLSTIAFEAIDGTFPDWRRVVPEETSGKTAQFNGDYLASFKKVARLAGAENTVPGVYHNGDGPALIDLGIIEHDYVACIMPMRCSATHQKISYRPDWVKAR